MTVSADVFAEGMIRVEEGGVTRWIDDPDFDSHRIIRPEDEEQESEATARKRELAAADADEETRKRAADTAGDLVRVVDPDGSARWVEPGRAPDDGEAEVAALTAEMKRYEELSKEVILAPAAKQRMEQIPGEIAAVYRRAEEAARAKDVDDSEFRQHHAEAVERCIGALREFISTKATVDQIRMAALSKGVYVEKLEVMAHQNRELHALLLAARGTAFA